MSDDIIPFIRRKDYILVEELGRGACGCTVLLRDPDIDQVFVCKKYLPYLEEFRDELFLKFVEEIKLLHKILHPNVVRIYNHFLYPEHKVGYILMEAVEGMHIDQFLSYYPEQINELFVQAIEGFRYLEEIGILHRDIRTTNLMVTDDGRLKIIDLGFGKSINSDSDFNKSVSLNWWCEKPLEFERGKYDFSTEVYFVGRLFQGLIEDNKIDEFKYSELLGLMCKIDPSQRISSFAKIETNVNDDPFYEIGFSDDDKVIYRTFVDAILSRVSSINDDAKFITDVEMVQLRLENVYRGVMLESYVPQLPPLLNCFVSGNYFFYKGNSNVPVSDLKDFLHLFKGCPVEKKKIILSNFHNRLDAVKKTQIPDYSDLEDIPF